MKSFYRIISHSILLIIAFAMFFFILLNCYSFSVASAKNINIEFPINNYLQISSSDKLSINDNYITIYDKNQSIIVVKSDDNIKLIDIDIVGDVLSIHQMGKVLFIQGENANYSCDVTLESPVLNTVILNSPVDEDFITSDSNYLFDYDFITSDGNYLYAKSTFGELTIYDFSNSITGEIVKTYSRISALTGDSIISAINDDIYIFSYTFSKLNIEIYNLTDETTRTLNTSLNAVINKVLISNNIIFNTDRGIIALDKETGNVLFESGIITKDFSTYQDKVIVCDGLNDVAVYSFASDNASLVFEYSIGMSGNGMDRLNNPNDFMIQNNVKIIADTANNRILFNSENSTTFLEVENPKKLAMSDMDMFVATDNEIHLFNFQKIQSSISIEGQILDIFYLDDLYILTTDALLMLAGNEIIEVAKISDGKSMSGSNDGNYIYILTKTEIIMIDSNGYCLNTNLNLTNDLYFDISVDYNGDIFLISKLAIDKYKNNLNSLEIIESYDLISEYSTTPVSLFIDESKKAYFVTTECFVASIEVDFSTKEDFQQPIVPILKNDEKYSFYTLKNDTASITISHPFRVDNISIFKNTLTFMIFDDISNTDEYAYAYIDGDFVYIPTKDIQITTPTLIEKTFISKADIKLKLNPFSNDYISIANGEKVEVIDDACGMFDNTYVRVKHNGLLYFAEATHLIPQEISVENKVFGKITASRIGNEVLMYASPSSDGKVIMKIKDGQEVEIIQEIDNYYLVIYNGMTGYVDKENVTIDALTTVQIIAIVLSIVVFLIGGIVFASIYKVRKKQEFEDDKSF